MLGHMENCQGDCCVAFKVPFTLQELTEGNVEDNDVEEAMVMAEMLDPITVEEANWRQEELVKGNPTEFTEADEGHLFMCKKWDEETRLCTDYENRPDMCRDFPYGKSCRYGCSCKGTEPAPEVII